MTWYFTPGVFPFTEGHEYTVDAETGCWVWALSIHVPTGYGQCQRRRYFQATGSVKPHRQGYIALNGPLPPSVHLHHLCHNRRCINPAHLEPVTAEAHQRHHRELESNLTHADVIAIREAAWNGVKGVDLARQYGLTTTQIGFMCDGSKWKHVGGPIGRPPKNCLLCGEPITGVMSRKAKYCSKVCCGRANRAKHKAALTATDATDDA